MNLKLTLLTLLQQGGGYLLPEDTLLREVLLRHPGATRATAAAALHELEILGWAVGVPNHLEALPRWGLTDEGLAQLRQRHL